MARVVHQTYESIRGAMSNPIIRQSQASWKDYSARHGCQYVFWTAEDRDRLMRQEHPDVYQQWSSLPLNVMKVDLWRYVMLYKYGGIYADADLIVKRNAPSLFSGGALLCTTENAEHYCNWLLSAPPRSALILHIFDHIKKKVMNTHPLTSVSFAENEHIVHENTGPGAFTEAINSWLTNHDTVASKVLSPRGGNYPGLLVLPRHSLRGGFATHQYMGGKGGGWVDLRDRLVLDGKEKLDDMQWERDRRERERLEKEAKEREAKLEKEAKEREKEAKDREAKRVAQELLGVEMARVNKEIAEKEALEQARLEKVREEKATLQKEHQELERKLRAREEEERQKDENVKIRTTSLEREKSDLLAELEDKDALFRKQLSNQKKTEEDIESMKTIVIDHAEEVAQKLILPLDIAVQEAKRASDVVSKNEEVLRKVDNKFPGRAGHDILERLQEMHSAIGTIADKLEATQSRLESMERTRLLEAQGAVATGILDDDEFVLVYVGPSAVDTVTLAHIRECEEGEYEITPEMQVGASAEEKTVFICKVTALDIIVTRKDGNEEGWISDLRFFLPRPATEGVCKYLEDVDDTPEAVTLEAMEGQAAVTEQVAGEEQEAVGEETAVEEQEAMAVDEEKTKEEAAEEQEEAAEERAAVEEQEASVDEQEAAVGELEEAGEREAVEEQEAELEKEATVTEKDLVEGEAVVQGIVVGREASEEPGAEALAEQSVAVAVQNAMEIEATDETTAGQDTPVKQEEVVKSEEGISAEIATTEVLEDMKLAVENESTDISSAEQIEAAHLNGSSSTPEKKRKNKKKRRKKKGKR